MVGYVDRWIRGGGGRLSPDSAFAYRGDCCASGSVGVSDELALGKGREKNLA